MADTELGATLSTRYSMFNAKSETAATLPSFREPYKRQRCVVPVSGFYEWARRQGHKQAYFYGVEKTGLLLAGLWDRWQGVDDGAVLLHIALPYSPPAPAHRCRQCTIGNRCCWIKRARGG